MLWAGLQSGWSQGVGLNAQNQQLDAHQQDYSQLASSFPYQQTLPRKTYLSDLYLTPGKVLGPNGEEVRRIATEADL